MRNTKGKVILTIVRFYMSTAHRSEIYIAEVGEKIKQITASDSIGALADVRKTREDADRISSKIGIWQREVTFPVETRTVKIPCYNNMPFACLSIKIN
jgi:hypothetical protein